jgi:hypothetical protein
MDHRITFDLNLLEFALIKAIESLQIESSLLNKINIKPEDLDRVASDKEDIMNFIEWHIPIIVRYIKMHKGDLDDLDDLSDLAIKSKAINKAAQAAIQSKINNKIVLGSQKVSTITIVTPENPQKPLLDAVFKNDSQEMPQKLTKLLKEMLCELESNFNKLTARKRLNDQIFNLVSQTVKEDQKVSYNPKRKKEHIQGNLIYNEDC